MDNFYKILAELRKAGLNDTIISDFCGCDRMIITRIRNGQVKKVGYKIGLKISELNGSKRV